MWNIGENTRAVAAGALTSHLLKCIDLSVFADVNPTVVLLGGRRIACTSKIFSLVPPFFSRFYLAYSYHY